MDLHPRIPGTQLRPSMSQVLRNTMLSSTEIYAAVALADGGYSNP